MSPIVPRKRRKPSKVVGLADRLNSSRIEELNKKIKETEATLEKLRTELKERISRKVP